jgi:hypothetical protein
MKYARVIAAATSNATPKIAAPKQMRAGIEYSKWGLFDHSSSLAVQVGARTSLNHRRLRAGPWPVMPFKRLRNLVGCLQSSLRCGSRLETLPSVLTARRFRAGSSPNLEFWLQAEQELTGKQTRERLGAPVVITALSACKGCALRPIEGQGRQPRSGKPRSGPRSLKGAQPPQPRQ